MGANYPLVSGTESPGSPSTLYVAQAATASLPAGTVVGQKARATDVGRNGAEMVWNGTRWIPVGGSALIDALDVPVGKASTFTGTTNGAITFGTAIPTGIANCYFYYPANSIVAAQAAGFYYTEMSSTTAAIVYNNSYTPAVGVYPTIPTSKTSFSGAVPGGAGVATEITCFVCPIRAGFLGVSGCIVSEIFIECNNNANAKYATVYLDSIYEGGRNYASSAEGFSRHIIKNISPTKQRSYGDITNTTNASTGMQTSVNTAIEKNIAYTFSSATATDFVIFSAIQVYARVIL